KCCSNTSHGSATTGKVDGKNGSGSGSVPSIVLYPNPVTTTLVCKLTDVQASLHNTLIYRTDTGEKVYDSYPDSTEITVDTSNFLKGTYVVIFVIDGYFYTKTFIVQ
ncbi:MAG: T9SS type A sorting domain-containing protein, partial [Prevotellaceae bacterium]|nr:T9SS type A sorting domain-containing protein [Prevotellaceae bacterium]